MNKDNLINLEDGEYFILDVMKYNDDDYAFVNKIGDNDESLNIYKVITKVNGEYKIVDNNSITDILLPIFEERITKEIMRMQKEGEI